MAEQTNVFQKIGAWALDVHKWLTDNLSDPAIARSLREDLGLNPDDEGVPREPPPGTRDRIDAFVAASARDLNEAAFLEGIQSIVNLVDTIRTFVDAAKADGTDAWDVMTLLFQVWVHDSLRLRNPSAYALMRLAGMLVQEEEALGQLDPVLLARAVRGEANSADVDRWVESLSTFMGALVVAAEQAVRAMDGVLDATYGWDAEPGEAAEAALVAGRTLTLVLHLPALHGLKPALSLVGVPGVHGGPGLFLAASVGFSISHDESSDDGSSRRYTFGITTGGAFGLFIPLSSEAQPLRAFGGFSPTISLRVDPLDTAARKPALVVGSPTGTRLEIGAFNYGIDVGADRAGFRVTARRGKLIIRLGDGDGFLSQLPGGTVEAPFDLGLLADTDNGVRFEGGSGLRVYLPVAASIAGVFTVQYLELSLRLDGSPALDLLGGFSLKLGPFKASVDRLGMTLDLANLRDGFNLGRLVKFVPPRGIGLTLDVGPVKGGGYLLIDPDHGEYAGFLELSILAFSIKAIGILSTKRPDGREGWALLLFIFGQFNIHIAFGIFWTGLGGMIGLHHRTDLDALTAGMKTGALDDVLFPENPVADAPRIINRYRQLFPIESGSLLLGPMLELSFSHPPIVYARLGLIFEVKNALSEGPSKLSKVVLVGQLLAQLPPKATGAPAIVKLLVDVVGFYDAEEKFLLIRARLRDSFVGIEGLTKIDLSGELLLAMRFGDPPTFVLSAGGFHPAFRDLPVGVPSDLQRLATSCKVGRLELRTEQYFAITSNSAQGGYRIEASANFGRASIKGWLGFDVLLYLSPRFYFLATFTCGVSLRAFGTNIASVRVDMSLEGPGEWRATGKFSFSILWWDVDVSFDERWGSAPAVDAGTASAAEALLTELNDLKRLEPLGPIGGNGLVSLAKIEGDAVLAHPLGQFSVRQKAVPFGVRIDRMGTKRLTEGAPQFDVQEVSVGQQPATSWELVSDHFARGQFMELSEQEKLAGRSFERFPCGVTVGAERFTVPAEQADVTVTAERKLLEPEPTIFSYWKAAALAPSGLSRAIATGALAHGAAERSARALREALLGEPGAAVVQPPPLAMARADTLGVAVLLRGAARSSPTIANQAAAPGNVVVEAFEVVP